jgi:hypothetical protein
MPLIPGDWSITGNVIDYIGDDHDGASPSYASGLELHRWASDLADDAVYSGDDQVDRTTGVPTTRSTDFILRIRAPYTITAAAIEHLYDASVSQGTPGVDQIIWDAIVVKGNASLINIIQNGSKLSDDFWNSGGGINPDPSQNITHRFLLKVHDFVANGGDIDGRNLVATNRPWNGTWGEFSLQTERGKNFLFFQTDTDINNENTEAAVAALVGITNSEGLTQLDLNNDSTDEFYYASWSYGANSINDLYERAKYLTYESSSGTLYGLDSHVFRGITHEIDYDTEAGGTFSEGASVTFGNGATAQILALRDEGTTGTIWVQLLTGTAPSDNDTITQGAVTAAVNGSVTSIPVRTPFIGQSTGSGLIAAYGIGVSSVLTPNDQFTDLDGNSISPPNVVNVTVSNLEVGDGSVTVYPWDGVTLDGEGNPSFTRDQMSIATALTGGSETSVEVDAIPDNTPASGTIRIVLDSGNSARVPYTSHNGTDTFTIASTDFSGDNASVANDSWVAYLDKVPASSAESFSYVFNSPVSAVAEVRDPVNLMQPFKVPVTLGNTSQTISTIRNSDA